MKTKQILKKMGIEFLLAVSLLAPVYLFHEYAHDYWVGVSAAYLTVIITGRKVEVGINCDCKCDKDCK